MAYGETQFGEVNPHPHFGLAEDIMRGIASMKEDNPEMYARMLMRHYNHIPDETKIAVIESFPEGTTPQEIGEYWKPIIYTRMFEFASDVERDLPALIAAAELGDL